LSEWGYGFLFKMLAWVETLKSVGVSICMHRGNKSRNNIYTFVLCCICHVTIKDSNPRPIFTPNHLRCQSTLTPTRPWQFGEFWDFGDFRERLGNKRTRAESCKANQDNATKELFTT